MTLTLAEESVPADEYVAPEKGAAKVSCTGKNGTVFGAGSYVRGDKVTMIAVPDEGYSFGGWYDKDGTLLSVSEVYDFVIQGDRTLKADFYIPQEYVSEESLTASRTGDVLTYEATVFDPEQAWLVAAWYDPTGRMLGSELLEAVSGQITADAAYTYKLFLVDRTIAPLTEAAVLAPVES